MFHGSLSHDLVVPIWKSGMSLGLMIDKRTKRFVNPFFLSGLCTLNPSTSALSLRLFGKDITTVGQQKANTQDENREHQTETPVEHAPMLDEDKEPTPVLEDGDYIMLDHTPGEVEENIEA